MQIGYFLLLFFIVSMLLVLRFKDVVTRIFSVAAICSFFLVMTLVSVLPATEVTGGRTFFIAAVTLFGIIFTIIVLINVFYKNLTKNR